MTSEIKIEIDNFIKCFKRLIATHGANNLERNEGGLLTTNCLMVNVSHPESGNSCLILVCKQDEKDYLKGILRKFDRENIIDEILANLDN